MINRWFFNKSIENYLQFHEYKVVKQSNVFPGVNWIIAALWKIQKCVYFDYDEYCKQYAVHKSQCRPS